MQMLGSQPSSKHPAMVLPHGGCGLVPETGTHLTVSQVNVRVHLTEGPKDRRMGQREAEVRGDLAREVMADLG